MHRTPWWRGADNQASYTRLNFDQAYGLFRLVSACVLAGFYCKQGPSCPPPTPLMSPICSCTFRAPIYWSLSETSVQTSSTGAGCLSRTWTGPQRTHVEARLRFSSPFSGHPAAASRTARQPDLPRRRSFPPAWLIGHKALVTSLQCDACRERYYQGSRQQHLENMATPCSPAALSPGPCWECP